MKNNFGFQLKTAYIISNSDRHFMHYVYDGVCEKTVDKDIHYLLNFFIQMMLWYAIQWCQKNKSYILSPILLRYNVIK